MIKKAKGKVNGGQGKSVTGAVTMPMCNPSKPTGKTKFPG